MPLTLLSTSVKRKGFSDITSATELGEYLAHGKYFTSGADLNFIEFADEGDAVIFRNDCTFVPPLNVPVTLKSPGEPMLLCNLQFNRVEYINDGPYNATMLKMYVDESVQGLTSIDPDTFNGRAEWHQYLKMTSANFDHDRPFWKDRNTKRSEFLESQRERKHICTLTNEERINFTWNTDLATTYRFNPSQHSSDLLPDQTNGWTIFREWKLLDGEDLSEVNQLTGNQDLVIAEGGIYELHFNIFFYAQAFVYGDGESAFSGTFETREELTQAVSLYLSTNDNDRSTAFSYYGSIQNWLFSSDITNFGGLFEDYTLLSDSALTSIAGWDVSNILNFSEMFKGNHKYGIAAVLAINNAWGASNWSQTIAQLKTAPFETRIQLVEAISGYPSSSAVYGTIDTWLFDPGLTDFSGLFEDITWLSDSALESITDWDVSNILYFTDMFKGNHKYGIAAVLAINNAWSIPPSNWSQTIAQLKTAPFETRTQLVDAISSYPSHMEVYGAIDTWLFDPGLTDFSGLFLDLTTFNEDISGWNVSNVQNMSSMFKGCSSFNQNLSSWNVSNVEDMTSMFENCNVAIANMTALDQWEVTSVGVTSVDNTELWSVDYIFQTGTHVEYPVSGNDDGASFIALDGTHSTSIFKTLTGQDGPWNVLQLNNAGNAKNSNAYVQNIYEIQEIDSCLKDGSAIYKAKSNVTHTLNTARSPHQTFSPRQYSFVKTGIDGSPGMHAGFDVLSTKSNYAEQYIYATFTNLPPGVYDLRIYGQTHTRVTGRTAVPNNATFGVTGNPGVGEQATSAEPPTGYVTFTGLTTSGPTLGFYMGPKGGSDVYSIGGVQLKRTYQVSKFKDMFKNSSWESTDSSVVTAIDDAWKVYNQNWYKNEAKLSEST